MPEGHSIHRIARQFNDVFTGDSVRVSSPQGRYTDGAALLDGARFSTHMRTVSISSCPSTMS